MSTETAPKPDRGRRNGRLRQFYCDQAQTPELGSGLNVDPCDIDGAGFDPEVYLSKLLQQRSLTDLMSEEQQMVEQIRQLDSDMQTLVYENYSKFISATDTIRQMKSDFHRMEQEMTNLAESVSAMSEQAGHINQRVGAKRSELRRLSSASSLLHKLQYLLELPARLTELQQDAAYQQAISTWNRADRVLSRYADLPSFRPIRSECIGIMDGLRQQLWQQFSSSEEGGGGKEAKQLAELVDLLGQLGESEPALSSAFLKQAEPKLNALLADLQQSAESQQPDVLEFIDLGCNQLISELCILIAVFGDIFTGAESRVKLNNYHECVMHSYLSVVIQRFTYEAKHQSAGGELLLVRACDRFHRKLLAMQRLVTEADLAQRALGVVCAAAAARAAAVKQQLDLYFSEALANLRVQLAAAGGQAKPNLPQIMSKLLQELVERIKVELAGLQAFLATDVSFSLKATFREEFCVTAVRQKLLSEFLAGMAGSCKQLCQLQPPPPPTLLLLLSRFCLDFCNSSLHYLCTLADEQFMIESELAAKLVTPVSQLAAEFTAASNELLQAFTSCSGHTLAGMLRKSVEARDWLQCIEPRSVRAVMKRIVEDLGVLDSCVASLYADSLTVKQVDRSSDSGSTSRRPMQQQLPTSSRSQWSVTPSTLGQSLMHKLFSDKVDLFGQVEPSRASAMAGIVRLALKTQLECVRLKTFGRYGLQQVQVDCHYLQVYLWRFVAEDNAVHYLLDEILASAAQRCLDPALMEHSVVELIVERD